MQIKGSGTKASDYSILIHVGIYSGETNFIYSDNDDGKYLIVANLSNGVSIINISEK